VWHTWQFL
jgi:hypothetical protein